jgi:hypothetical protein
MPHRQFTPEPDDSGKDSTPSPIPGQLHHWREWLDSLLSGYPDISRDDAAEIRERVATFTEPPECEHRPELRRLTAADSTTRFVRQCVHCGQQSNQIAKAKLTEQEMTAAAEVESHESFAAKREHTWAACQAIRMQMLQEVGERIQEANRKEYSAYLLLPQWRDIRAKRMAIANGICEGCGDRPATQVHHLTYDHRGHEMLWELRAVCDECHDLIHKKGEYGRS